jgi:TusA-related sulfurtransferase
LFADAIVQTRDAMSATARGPILEILSDDLASDPDTRSWVRRTGNVFLAVTTTGPVYQLLVRKAR